MCQNNFLKNLLLDNGLFYYSESSLRIKKSETIYDKGASLKLNGKGHLKNDSKGQKANIENEYI